MSPVKLLFSLSMLSSVEGECTRSGPHSRWGGIKCCPLGWGVLICIIWNSSIRKICPFSHIGLFIQSFIYTSMDSCVFTLYCGLSSNITFILFRMFELWPLRALSQVGSCVPLTCPHPFLFRGLSGSVKCSRLTLYFSCPNSSLLLSLCHLLILTQTFACCLATIYCLLTMSILFCFYMHFRDKKNTTPYFHYTSLELEIALDFGFHPICWSSRCRAICSSDKPASCILIHIFDTFGFGTSWYHLATLPSSRLLRIWKMMESWPFHLSLHGGGSDGIRKQKVGDSKTLYQTW